MKVEWHPHVLKKHKPGEAYGWACDGKKHFAICQSGITGFYQTANTDGWRCLPCDFDLCQKCIQVSMLIECVKERED